MGREYKQVSEIRSFVPDAGDLLFRDDFSSGLRFSVSGSAAGKYVAVTDYRPLIGSNCLEVSNRADTFVDGNTVVASSDIRLPGSRYLSSLFAFRYLVAANLDGVWQRFVFYMQSRWVEFGVRYDVQNDRLQVYTDATSWENVVETDVRLLGDSWVNVRFAVDFFANKYLSLVIGGVSYDVSSFSIHSADAAVNLKGVIQLGCEQQGTSDGFITHFSNLSVIGG